MTQDNNIITYQSSDNQISFNVSVFEETVWLTQEQISNIFNEFKLDKESVVIDFFTTAPNRNK